MTEIILINITGTDKPGLTATFTQILAKSNVQILDIGQAVIHDTLSFGILIASDENSNNHALRKELLFAAYNLEQQIKFTPVSLQNYQNWVQNHGKSRYIVTILAHNINAEHLWQVSSICAKHNLNIENIERLSGRINLAEKTSTSIGCIELDVRGNPHNLSMLKLEFLQIAGMLNIDVAFQIDSLFRSNRRLAVFDMDSTLIEVEVIDELAKLHGVGSQVSQITERAMQGEIDFAQSFKQRMAHLKGLDESSLQQVAQNLPLTTGADVLFAELKRLGYKTAIISGGFGYFARYLQQKLGIDYVFANELDIENGKVTGKVKQPIVDAKRKADLLQELALRENITLEQTIAVGDGANDLPMLALAGLGIAFRAKPLVKQSAEHAISNLGLNAILYLLGFRDKQHSK